MRIVSVGNWFGTRRTKEMAITIEFDTVEEATLVTNTLIRYQALQDDKREKALDKIRLLRGIHDPKNQKHILDELQEMI